MAKEGISEALYLDCVPRFVGPALERLYENVFSVLPREDHGASDLSTYVETRDGQPQTLLLFRRRGHVVQVVNEGIQIDAARIERFAARVFRTFPSVSVIRFNAIRAELDRCSLPFQKAPCSEDIIVTLPGSVDAYFSSLGNATRKNIKRYRNRFARCFPEARHRVLSGAEVTQQHITAILSLNQARMASKQKLSAYAAGPSEQLADLVRRYGFVTVLELDGRVMAGEICSRIGRNYFSHIGAPDPAYDDYGLGTLSCYLTICECIRRGGAAFHFLWGRYQYKFLLGGVQHELARLTLYRSLTQLCLNGHTALQFALHEQLRKIRHAAERSPAMPAAQRARQLLVRMRHPALPLHRQ